MQLLQNADPGIIWAHYTMLNNYPVVAWCLFWLVDQEPVLWIVAGYANLPKLFWLAI